MSDRIQQALDGERAISDLTPEERAEFHRYRATICIALGPTQQWPAIDVAPEVMRRVAPGPIRRGLRAAGRSLWSPRAISLRPAYGLAAALAIAGLFWRSASTPSRSGPADPQRIVVTFRVSEREAQQVALVGDFNGWRPEHRLRRTPDGVWSVDLALEPGVYNYAFVIDGTTLRLDPLAPRVADGFGGSSSRVAVFAPGPQS